MDRIKPEVRSANMARVKGKNTSPELAVRRYLHGEGFRFRLHRKDLPGKPDIVLGKHRTVVFVNGCFWHGHDCARGRRPSTNTAFWNEKLDKNIARDKANRKALVALGWRVLVVWECELKADKRGTLERLVGTINDRSRSLSSLSHST